MPLFLICCMALVFNCASGVLRQCPNAQEMAVRNQPIEHYAGIWYEVYNFPRDMAEACPCHFINNTIVQKENNRKSIFQDHFCYDRNLNEWTPYSHWELEEITEGVAAFRSHRRQKGWWHSGKHDDFFVQWDDPDSYTSVSCAPGLFLSTRSFRILSRTTNLSERLRGLFAGFLEKQGADWEEVVYLNPDNFSNCPERI